MNMMHTICLRCGNRIGSALTEKGRTMTGMPNKEKVINELVEHIESALSVDSDYVDCVRTDLLQYAVALLKKQKAVEPKTVPEESREEIAGEICDKYCKYTDACEDLDELYKQHCHDCPLNRI